MREVESNVYMEDCVAAMKRYPDNHFDLAIVDPPYGLGESIKKRENTTSDKWKKPPKKEHNPKEWDKEPPKLEYFSELFRVSKNQIVWGANHFISRMPYDSSCWVIWDKKNGNNDFADAELAWTSFNKAVRKFDWLWNGFQKQRPEERIHPTQKPVALYEWLLHNYAKRDCPHKHTKDYDDLCSVCKPPFRILDTHLGSGSSRIAAYKGGFDFTGFEIDADYFAAQDKRFNQFKSQLTLF